MAVWGNWSWGLLLQHYFTRKLVFDHKSKRPAHTYLHTCTYPQLHDIRNLDQDYDCWHNSLQSVSRFFNKMSDLSKKYKVAQCKRLIQGFFLPAAMTAASQTNHCLSTQKPWHPPTVSVPTVSVWSPVTTSTCKIMVTADCSSLHHKGFEKCSCRFFFPPRFASTQEELTLQLRLKSVKSSIKLCPSQYQSSLLAQMLSGKAFLSVLLSNTCTHTYTHSYTQLDAWQNN